MDKKSGGTFVLGVCGGIILGALIDNTAIGLLASPGFGLPVKLNRRKGVADSSVGQMGGDALGGLGRRAGLGVDNQVGGRHGGPGWRRSRRETTQQLDWISFAEGGAAGLNDPVAVPVPRARRPGR